MNQNHFYKGSLCTEEHNSICVFGRKDETQAKEIKDATMQQDSESKLNFQLIDIDMVFAN